MHAVVAPQTLDCDIYERIQEYLTTASSTAADIARVEANTFSAIAEEAEKVCCKRLSSLQSGLTLCVF